MGENVLVGAGGTAHASAGGGTGHAGAGGRGAGMLMRAQAGKGHFLPKGAPSGVPTREAWARAGKRHVVPIKTPLPFGSGWIFGTPQSVGLGIIPSNSQLPRSQARGNCTARAM